MPLPGVKFATLNEEQLKTLQALEKELGRLPAGAGAGEATPGLADPPNRSQKVQEVEEKLGVMLIAYRADR